MRYLLNVVNTYRVPTVEDALALRDELQETPGCELVNFQYTTTWGLGNKTLHLSPALKQIFYDNINNGKQYY